MNLTLITTDATRNKIKYALDGKETTYVLAGMYCTLTDCLLSDAIDHLFSGAEWSRRRKNPKEFELDVRSAQEKAICAALNEYKALEQLYHEGSEYKKTSIVNSFAAFRDSVKADLGEHHKSVRELDELVPKVQRSVINSAEALLVKQFLHIQELANIDYQHLGKDETKKYLSQALDACGAALEQINLAKQELSPGNARG